MNRKVKKIVCVFVSRNFFKVLIFWEKIILKVNGFGEKILFFLLFGSVVDVKFVLLRY